MEETIRVRAVEGHVVPYVDRSGRTVMFKNVGRAPDGTPFPYGEEVPKTSYYVKQIARGALVPCGAPPESAEDNG